MDPNSQAFQQLLRKIGDAAAGALVTYGVISADMAVVASGVVVGVATLVWWFVWNRNRTT